MSFEEIKELAFHELDKSALSKFKSRPPLLRLYYLLGIKVRPPHYNNFYFNLLHNGLFLGFILVISSLILIPERAIYTTVSGGLAVAIISGYISAWYYKYSAENNKLSTWDSLPLQGKA